MIKNDATEFPETIAYPRKTKRCPLRQSSVLVPYKKTNQKIKMAGT